MSSVVSSRRTRALLEMRFLYLSGIPSMRRGSSYALTCSENVVKCLLHIVFDIGLCHPILIIPL